MKFTKLHISHFGKFTDRSYEFSDGLNILYGKNEAGKSTLAAYLKFMLYGFPTKGARNAEENDKLHYMPWNGGAAAGRGEIVLSDGKRYRIERSSGAKNTVHMTELPAEKEIHLGKTIGEECFGVDEKAFSRMAYIRERDISGENFDNLSESIQNIVFAADESVNIEKAHKKLREYRNFYRTPRGTGQCHDLEEKIRSLRQDFDKAAETHKILLEAEAKLSELRANMRKNAERSAALDAELCEIAAQRAEELLAAVLQSKRALEESKANYDRALKAIGTIDKALPESVIAAAEKVRECETERQAVEKALHDAEALIERIEAEQFYESTVTGESVPLTQICEELTGQRRRLKRLRLFSLISAGLAVVAFLSFSLTDRSMQAMNICGAATALFATLFLAFGIASFARGALIGLQVRKYGFSRFSELEKASRQSSEESEEYRALSEKLAHLREQATKTEAAYTEAQEALRQILEKAGGEAENPYEFAEQVRARLNELSQAENEYHRNQSAYDAYLTSCDLHALTETAEKKRGIPTRERAIVEREAEFCKKAGEALAEKEKDYIKAAAAPSSTLRKPAEILAERTATEACLAEATQKADALELAMQALDEACEEMRCGISPRIAARAGELFRAFTGNADEALALTPEFALSALRDGLYRENGNLSAGTSDAAYLAVRIALCEALFAEPPILVLDESFAYMDEERMSRVLKALSTLAERFQIFVFTCHEAVVNAAAGLPNACVTRMGEEQ